MSDFQERLIKALDIEVGQTDSAELIERAIIAKATATKCALERSIENSQRWEMRFEVLAENSPEEAVELAMSTSPSEQKMQLLRWLDPKSKNFLGSGMTYTEYSAHSNIDKFRQSFSSQFQDEMNRRVKLISSLGYEYKRISNIDIHGTAAIERAIEDIIGGIWEKMKTHVEWAMDWDGSIGVGIPDPERENVIKTRMALWAPAYRLMHEACYHLTPPEITREYENAEDMIDQEGGLVRISDAEDSVFTTVSGAEKARSPEVIPPLMIPRYSLSKIKRLFDLGVRWHGPEKYHPGYWHMQNKEPFPDDPEEFFGIKLSRIYTARQIYDWSHRHKEDECGGI